MPQTGHTAAKTRKDTSPERKCIISGEISPKQELLRFVVAPDGTVVFDRDGKLEGRGLWVTSTRDAMELAIKKNAFAKAAREAVRLPDDLVNKVEAALCQRVQQWLSLGVKAGMILSGFIKVEAALNEGHIGLLLQAIDASEDGKRKIRKHAHAIPVLEILTRSEMASALGREDVVHVAMKKNEMNDKLLCDIRRLSGFRATNGL